MTRDEYEDALACQIFMKESHLDPSDNNDFNAPDFGWSTQEEDIKDHYRTIADWLYGWIRRNPPPQC